MGIRLCSGSGLRYEIIVVYGNKLPIRVNNFITAEGRRQSKKHDVYITLKEKFLKINIIIPAFVQYIGLVA